MLLLAAVALVPGSQALPPVDRDESRFALASWQMLDGDFPDDWLVPRLQDRPRLNKPPLIYWAQAGVVGLAGADGSGASATHGGIGWFRVPSLIAAALAGLITWRLGARVFAPGVGWLAGAMMVVCVVVMWDARQARSDQLLLLCTTLAMWGLWGGMSAAERRRSGVVNAGSVASSARLLVWGQWWWWALWGGIALGVMTKGPITPMVAALTAVSYAWLSGRWRWLLGLGPISGVLLTLALGVPWVMAVASQVGFGEYARIIFDETLGRAGSPKEGHWGPPGYHLVLLPVMFWPGSLLTAAAIARVLRKRKAGQEHESDHAESRPRRGIMLRPRRFVAMLGRLRPIERFLLCWIVPSWIVFELVSTKLPHYTLPLYPGIALLTARGVFAAAAGSMPGLRAAGARLGVMVWQGIGILLAALPVIAVVALAVGFRAEFGDELANEIAQQTGLPNALPIGLLSAMLVCMIIGIGLLARRRGWLLAQLAAIGVAAIIGVLVFRIALPTMPALWASSTVNARLAALDPAGERPVLLVGYHEDSLLFLTRGRALRTARQDFEEALRTNPAAIVVLQLREEDRERLTDAETALTIHAFNYSKGDWIRLQIIDQGRARELLPPARIE